MTNKKTIWGNCQDCHTAFGVIHSQCGSNTGISLALAISSGIGKTFAGTLVLAVGLAEMVDAIL